MWNSTIGRRRGRSVFHFGTGEHPILALENAKLRKPKIANAYKAMLVDIYTLEPQLLPEFDVVSLFDLGEFHDPVCQKCAPLDDRKLLVLMVRKLKPGGCASIAAPTAGRNRSRSSRVPQGEEADEAGNL